MDESGEKRTLSAMKPGEEEEEHQFDARTPSPSATKRLKTAVGAVLSGSISALTSLASSSAGGSRSVPRASFTTGSTGTSSTASTPVPTDLNGAVSSSPVDYAAPAAAASAALLLLLHASLAARRRARSSTSTDMRYVIARHGCSYVNTKYCFCRCCSSCVLFFALTYIKHIIFEYSFVVNFSPCLVLSPLLHTAWTTHAQQVKRDNNYVVRGGEYVHGAYDANGTATDGGALARLPRPSQAKQAKKKPSARAPSKAEQARAAHNEVVKSRVAGKQKARSAFLAKHSKIIGPFVDEKTSRYLSNTPPQKKDTWRDMDMQPDMIQGDMRDYQMIGLNWMAKMHSMNLGMILGDEMGLGKTLQTISLLCHIKEHEGVTGPSLVICPLSVLYSWCSELEKWAPELKYLRLHSSCLEEREVQRKTFTEKATSYDVVVTTYEMAKAPSLASLWSRMHFNYLVLDEGHKIKNHESLIAQGVRHIHCENRLILTGTPLQNNLVELWSLLNFLYPNIFTTSKPFAEAFDIVHNTVDKAKLALAHNLLDLFMIRRMKKEVEKLMPPKIETKVLCPLSTTQIFWYKAILMKDAKPSGSHG